MRIPKYLQIKSELQNELHSGKFKTGDRFYTESDISSAFNVSSITAIRALNELASDGYIIRRQGKGSYVSRSKKNQLVSFSDIEKFPLENETVKVISIKEGASSRMMRKLELSEFHFYYQIDRVRFDGDTPYIYHSTFIADDFVKHRVSDITAFSSIYHRFQEDFNINVNDEYSIETNEVVYDIPSHVREALRLNTSEPAMLQIKKSIHRQTHRVLEYVETYKHLNYYKIEIISNDFN